MSPVGASLLEFTNNELGELNYSHVLVFTFRNNAIWCYLSCFICATKISLYGNHKGEWMYKERLQKLCKCAPPWHIVMFATSSMFAPCWRYHWMTYMLSKSPNSNIRYKVSCKFMRSIFECWADMYASLRISMYCSEDRFVSDDLQNILNQKPNNYEQRSWDKRKT